MIQKYILFFVSIAIGFISAFAGRESVDSVAVTEAADATVRAVQDSIATTELQEVIVTGDKAWIKDGVINVIPSKQEKNLSNSPETLIESMHLPFVKVKDGNVTSQTGEPVRFFINGVEVNAVDMRTFWPKDVTLVQYLENPPDPMYGGAKYVINFKMHEYEAGGVTKINAYQTVPNNGSYSLASKLVYKKMTYGVMFDGGYSRDHRRSQSGETKYNDIYYDNNFYGEIIRNEETSRFIRNDNTKFAINAKYTSDKGFILHTFSLGWSRDPGSGSNSSNLWSENLFGSDKSSTFSRSRSLSPQFSGNYGFKFSDRWFLYVITAYSHTHNNSYSRNILGDTDPVDNTVTEDVNTIKFLVMPSFNTSDKLSFQIRVNGNANWYSSLYGGSVNTRQKQARQQINGIGYVWWRPRQNFITTLEAGANAALWKIGDVKENSVSPVVDLNIWWNPTRKFILSGSTKFSFSPASASASNPVMVKSSDLLWIMGNPHLKGWKQYFFNLRASYIAMRELSLSCGASFSKNFDRTYESYRPAPKEYGGIIRESMIASPYDSYYAFISLESSLLDGKLNINAEGYWSRSHVRTNDKRNVDYLHFYGRAEYMLGNFRFDVSYDSGGKDYDPITMTKGWMQDYCNAYVTYGNGDFYVSLGVFDIFHNKLKRWERFESPNYSTFYTTYETGRSLKLNVSYTFGYGKKVDKNIDISGPESTTTSVRKVE